MALTRSFLKGMGLTEEQVGAIVEAHTDTVNNLKDKIKTLEATIAEAEEAAKQGEEAESQYKEKYEKEHADFEMYKTEEAKEKMKGMKKSAYADVLRQAGISEKRIAQILKIANIEDIKVDKEGQLEDADDVSQKVKEEWSEFIPKVKIEGQAIELPPVNSGGKEMTRDQIMAISDRAERRKAIKENPQAFGVK